MLTYFGVSFFGLKEANILMARLISLGWGFFFLFKIFFYSFLAYICLSIDREGIISYGLTISGIILTTWNVTYILSAIG